MLSSPFLFLPFYLFIINAFRQQPSNFFCWSIVNFAAVLWRLHISIVVGRANVAFFLPTMPEFASSTWMHRAINKKKQANEKKETFNDFNLPRVSKNGGISNKLQRKVAESRTQRKCAAANSNDWWMLEFTSYTFALVLSHPFSDGPDHDNGTDTTHIKKAAHSFNSDGARRRIQFSRFLPFCLSAICGNNVVNCVCMLHLSRSQWLCKRRKKRNWKTGQRTALFAYERFDDLFVGGVRCHGPCDDHSFLVLFFFGNYFLRWTFVSLKCIIWIFAKFANTKCVCRASARACASSRHDCLASPTSLPSFV